MQPWVITGELSLGPVRGTTRFMRRVLGLFSVWMAFVSLAACGDDGGGKIKVPDAKVFNDAPPDAPNLCTAEASYPTPSFGSSRLRARRCGAGDPDDRLFEPGG